MKRPKKKTDNLELTNTTGMFARQASGQISAEQLAKEFRIHFPISLYEKIQNYNSSLTREDIGKLIGSGLIKLSMFSQFALGFVLSDMVIRAINIPAVMPIAGEYVEISLRIICNPIAGYGSYKGKNDVVLWYGQDTYAAIANFSKWFKHTFNVKRWVKEWDHVQWLTFLICLGAVPVTSLVFGYLTPLSFRQMAAILKIGFNNRFTDFLIRVFSNRIAQTIPQVASTFTNFLGLNGAIYGATSQLNNIVYRLFENPYYRERCQTLYLRLEAARLRWKHYIEDAIYYDNFTEAENFLNRLLDRNDISLKELTAANTQALLKELADAEKQGKALRRKIKTQKQQLERAKKRHDKSRVTQLENEIPNKYKQLNEIKDKYYRIKENLNKNEQYVRAIVEALRQKRKDGSLAKELLKMSFEFAPQSIPKPRNKKEVAARVSAIVPFALTVAAFNSFIDVTKQGVLEYGMDPIAEPAAVFDMIGMGSLAAGIIAPFTYSLCSYFFGRNPRINVLEPSEEAKIQMQAIGWAVIGSFPIVAQSIIVNQQAEAPVLSWEQAILRSWKLAFIGSFFVECFCIGAIERQKAENAAKAKNYLIALALDGDAELIETGQVSCLTPEVIEELYEIYTQKMTEAVEAGNIASLTSAERAELEQYQAKKKAEKKKTVGNIINVSDSNDEIKPIDLEANGAKSFGSDLQYRMPERKPPPPRYWFNYCLPRTFFHNQKSTAAPERIATGFEGQPLLGDGTKKEQRYIYT